MSFEKSIKRIDHRDWHEIQDKWLGFIPSFITPGAVPQHEILEFIGLNEVFNKANKSPGEYKEEKPVLRQEILREAIYFIHKATHVSGTAISHLDNGILGWGLSSAYQSSFFALKGILGLLGLSFPRINSTLMIDCFPKLEELSSNQKRKGIKPKMEMKFVVLPALTHTHMWQIFQRVLNVTTIKIWRQETISYLKALKVSDFAQQRNNLHYKNNFWILPENIYKPIFDNTFGVQPGLIESIDYNDLHTRNDFSFLLNYILLSFSYSLINDLSQFSNEIKSEYNLMQETLNDNNHSRYFKSII